LQAPQLIFEARVTALAQIKTYLVTEILPEKPMLHWMLTSPFQEYFVFAVTRRSLACG
jgi:hypothetical protein